jgi:outer membrane lipoprotein-sorting protein
MFRSHFKVPFITLAGFSMLMLSMACGGGGASSAGSGSSPSSKPASSSTGDDQVVSRAIQAQNDLRDLKATIHSDSSQGGQSFTTDGTVEWTASPERFYAKTNNSLTNRPTEVILDTPTQSTYVKTAANWIKTPVGSGLSSQSGGFMPTLKGDAFKGFQVVGKETVEGKQTWHLSGPLPYTAGAATATKVQNATGTLDVWVGQNDYRLVKQVEDLKSSQGGAVSTKATVVVNSVNSGLTIQLPNTA